MRTRSRIWCCEPSGRRQPQSCWDAHGPTPTSWAWCSTWQSRCWWSWTAKAAETCLQQYCRTQIWNFEWFRCIVLLLDPWQISSLMPNNGICCRTECTVNQFICESNSMHYDERPPPAAQKPPIERYFRVLGLPATASHDEVRKAGAHWACAACRSGKPWRVLMG